VHDLNQLYLKSYCEFEARYFRWFYFLEQTRNLEGDIVELGVGPGRFLVYCASWLKASRSSKCYWGYDTFSGFPSVTSKDAVGLTPERLRLVRPGTYVFSRRRIERLIESFQFRNVKLIEGDFAKTLDEMKPEKISFLFMDCDLYESYRIGLEKLYDHVVPGGVILFDEYERTHEWPGARFAVDEFFQGKIEKPQKLFFSTSYYVVRSSSVESSTMTRCSDRKDTENSGGYGKVNSPK
jgi:hypothetical protein